jgi:hypothetical protein
MMRKTLINALAALMLAPAPVMAADHPVVVELFTAQGCSSCPPADAFLQDLAARDDVIALSLHVDYWDYMGWQDTFGSPENTARQRGYARAQGQKMVYTPQMVINGTDQAVGTHRIDVIDLVDAHLAEDSGGVSLDIARDGDAVRLTARASRRFDTPLIVQRVRIRSEATVTIKRGENAGRVARHVNIVTGIEHLAEWDTQAPLVLEMAAGEGASSVVLLQEGRHGPIVAAARVGP